MLAGPNILEKLIPQREPMVMIDTLISHEDAKTISAFTIKQDNIFVQEGYFTEAGLIENMAQTAAMRNGWKASLEQDEGGDFKPAVGVIGSVKNFKLFRLPEVNTCLETEIVVQAEVFSATVIQASVRSDGELLAEAELKIFIQE